MDHATGTFELLPSRDISLGALRVTRALPAKSRRTVGPWCFLDRFGPLTFADGKPMDVAPHPHIGMQTVTWLLEGEVLHQDSLGSEAIVRPGGVNVMTAGRGIAHAEQTPARAVGRLNGVQLWVALPDAHRAVEPSFDTAHDVPLLERSGGSVHVFAGSFDGAAAPGRHFSPLVGADVRVHASSTFEPELEPGFEYALLLLEGDCAFENRPVADAGLHFLGTGRASAPLRSRGGGRVLLIGGPPFSEPILMWWNFVARRPDEIAEARADWEANRRFGEVSAYRGERLRAPALMPLVRPNPIS